MKLLCVLGNGTDHVYPDRKWFESLLGNGICFCRRIAEDQLDSIMRVPIDEKQTTLTGVKAYVNRCGLTIVRRDFAEACRLAELGFMLREPTLKTKRYANYLTARAPRDLWIKSWRSGHVLGEDGCRKCHIRGMSPILDADFSDEWVCEQSIVRESPVYGGIQGTLDFMTDAMFACLPEAMRRELEVHPIDVRPCTEEMMQQGTVGPKWLK